MWAASLTRIGIATSLAVASGLSLFGLLQSFPGKEPTLARDTAIAEPAARLPIINLREPAAFEPRPQPAQRSQTPSSDYLDAPLLLAPVHYGPSSPLPSAVETRRPVETWSPDETEPAGASAFAAIAPAAGGPAAQPAPRPQPPSRAQAHSVTLPLQQDVVEPEALAPTDIPTEEAPARAGVTVSVKPAEPRTPAEPTTPAEPAAAPNLPETPAAQPAAPDSSTETASLATPAVVPPAAASPKPATTGPASDRIGFIIIGSFRNQVSADRHVADFAQWQPQVQLKQSAGQVQYRVVVGPFDGADLPAALRRIAEHGVSDAWQITLPRPAGAASLSLRRPDSLG